LGFNIRHYPTPNSSRSGYKLLIKPSPDSIRQIKRKLKGLWRKHVGSPTVAGRVPTADIVSRRPSYRLSDDNQTMIRMPNWFSSPRTYLLAYI
jgi:hypothetical protein